MPCPALEPALHAQPFILYIAVPSGFPFGLACPDSMYTPVGGKAPSVHFSASPCSLWEPWGALPAWWCGVCAPARWPVALDSSAGCLARCVPCCAVLRSFGGVCVGASVWLPEARVACWHAGLLHSVAVLWALCRLCRHKCSVIWCPGVQRLQRPCAVVLVSSSSLNLLPLGISCTQVVCPDAGTPCALPWVSRDLVPWCMIVLEVMRAGAKSVAGPPPWQVTFLWLMCFGVGVPRTARCAGLGVTYPCLPAGAGGLVGPVCWTPGSMDKQHTGPSYHTSL